MFATLIGVLLAVIGSILIGGSYTASKTAHNYALDKLKQEIEQQSEETERLLDGSVEIDIEEDENEAIDSNLRYSMSEMTKIPIWWYGIIMLLVGEICNFMAYGFAPTSVVAPLGTLSIISGSISGFFYLGERVVARNIMGMALAICGATLVVLVGTSDESDLDQDALLKAVTRPKFLIYIAVKVLTLFILSVVDGVKTSSGVFYGEKSMIIRVTITAIYSGFSALSTKAVSSILRSNLISAFSYWIFYVLIIILIVCALLALYYTNKALSSFEATQVLPAEFASFTLSAVLGSAILYGDFDEASIIEILLFNIGCLIVFLGVYLMTSESKMIPQLSNSNRPLLRQKKIPQPNRLSVRSTTSSFEFDKGAKAGIAKLAEAFAALTSNTRSSLIFEKIVSRARSLSAQAPQEEVTNEIPRPSTYHEYLDSSGESSSSSSRELAQSVEEKLSLFKKAKERLDRHLGKRRRDPTITSFKDEITDS